MGFDWKRVNLPINHCLIIINKQIIYLFILQNLLTSMLIFTLGFFFAVEILKKQNKMHTKISLRAAII